jgi:hypothetical protein
MGIPYPHQTLLACALLACTLLIAPPGHALTSGNPCQPAYSSADPSFNALLSQFHTLAPLRGHFDGAGWNDAIDRYGAQKYCVLDALRLELVRQQPGLSQALSWLGAPDARWPADKPPQRPVPADAPDTLDEYLWYRWRGQRDGLLLGVQQQRVVYAAWSMSGE